MSFIALTVAGAAGRASLAQPIAQLLDARATAGPGTTAPADILDRARALVDDRVHVAIRGRVAEAHDHFLNLIMIIKSEFVKRPFSWA
jgi:hypothetical protein